MKTPINQAIKTPKIENFNPKDKAELLRRNICISRNVTFGNNVVIGDDVTISQNVKIMDGVSICN